MANKRYDQFTAGTPASTDISLFADPATGALKKYALSATPATLDLRYPWVTAFRMLGNDIINFVLQWTTGNITSVFNLVNTGLYSTIIWLPAGTVTGIRYSLITAGAFTGSGFNGFGLYSISGTTATLIRATANDPNIWKATAQQWQNAALTSTIVVTAGFYYIMACYNRSAETTIPTVGSISYNNTQYNSKGFTSPSIYLMGTYSPFTALPSTLTVSTANTVSNVMMCLGCY